MPVKPLAEGITRSPRVCRGVDGGSGFAALGEDRLDLLLERRDDLVLLDPADDLALAEDHALAASGRYADVGVPGLAGAVDDATHDRHLDRCLDVLDVLVNLVRQLEEVNLDTPAGGAGDEGGAVLAQAEALEDLVGDEDLLDRVGGQ